MSPFRARLGRALLSVVMLAPVGACDSGGTECECPSTGLTVTLPATLAGHVASLASSGAACANAPVEPRVTSGASVLHITPTTTGPCHLELVFTDGTIFSDDLTVVETTGCCAGLRTSPLGAAAIDVPAPTDASVHD